MTVFRPIAVLLLAVTFVAGCANERGDKETAGTILGGIGGAVAGAQFGGGSGRLATTAAGTLIGAWIGSEVGKSLDRADRQAMQQAQVQAHAAPVGETIRWNNPDSGNYGTFTPTRDGQSESGRYCREYQTTVTVGGNTETAYGTACQQPDGSWQIVQ